jgi:hypothetical protein
MYPKTALQPFGDLGSEGESRDHYRESVNTKCKKFSQIATRDMTVEACMREECRRQGSDKPLKVLRG